MGIGLGLSKALPKSSIRSGAESAKRRARKRLLLYPHQPHRSGGRQCIQQGFPKAGGIKLLGDFRTPRPLISIAVF